MYFFSKIREIILCTPTKEAYFWQFRVWNNLVNRLLILFSGGSNLAGSIHSLISTCNPFFISILPTRARVTTLAINNRCVLHSVVRRFPPHYWALFIIVAQCVELVDNCCTDALHKRECVALFTMSSFSFLSWLASTLLLCFLSFIVYIFVEPLEPCFRCSCGSIDCSQGTNLSVFHPNYVLIIWMVFRPHCLL